MNVLFNKGCCINHKSTRFRCVFVVLLLLYTRVWVDSGDLLTNIFHNESTSYVWLVQQYVYPIADGVILNPDRYL